MELGQAPEKAPAGTPEDSYLFLSSTMPTHWLNMGTFFLTTGRLLALSRKLLKDLMVAKARLLGGSLPCGT